MRRRSQAVQRNMPRPSDANAAVLRPANVDPPLTGLQQVKKSTTNKETAIKKSKQKHRQTVGVHRLSKRKNLTYCGVLTSEMS